MRASGTRGVLKSVCCEEQVLPRVCNASFSYAGACIDSLKKGLSALAYQVQESIGTSTISVSGIDASSPDPA